MSKVCPFCKEIYYTSGRATGFGYPDMWEATEKFCECLKETCMMWCKFNETAAAISGEDGFCKMEK